MKEMRRILLKLQKRAEGDPVKKERKKNKWKKDAAGNGKTISCLQLH